MFAPFECPAPRRVSTRLGPVSCVDVGQGRPLLAIHGGMGGWDQSWVLARALFAASENFRIIAVARPGYPGTPPTMAGSYPEQADLLAALMDTLGLDRALVAAISAGGPSALQLVLRHHERCERLILVSAATGQLESPPRILSRLKAMSIMAHVPGAALLLRHKMQRDPESALRRSMQEPGMADAILEHPEAWALFRAFQASMFHQLAGRIRGTRQDIALLSQIPPLPPADIAVPVLTIHGADDVIVPPQHADNVRAAEARHVRIGGAGHVALFTHLDAVREAASRFLH